MSGMDGSAPHTTYRQDYRPPDYLVERIELHFDLQELESVVRARLTLRFNPNAVQQASPRLVLQGRELALRAVRLDGRTLTCEQYRVDAESLTLPQAPVACELEIETALRAQDNTSLEGLYKSGGNFCTQCEAEGFRKITYYPDRPDVLARFTTTIVADKARYPVLLSNGNFVDGGDLPDGRHWARWEDPFPKPSYLFALVAGDLACIADEFVTASGRWVQLLIYVQHHNADRCQHALASLKEAMRWDERVYGREYDLNAYIIVAVDDFNMGAMENKGLNIFNSSCVLAGPESATDSDYRSIQRVVGHEYFHNWSGNRVTCRDWFQLSLKEGFTVFRDQEFSADLGSRPVQRIADVNALRTAQFREDAGPMAHSVRPDSYVEISNFYTATVYSKGAEVVRMLRVLLGAERFRRGTDLYFSRHDGQAVTCDDFVRAMEDASGADLGQFRLWYDQAGTPELQVRGEYDAAARSYALTVRQHCPPTPGQPEKRPMHIPFAMGLLDTAGNELSTLLEGEQQPVHGTRILELRNLEERFVFRGLSGPPVPSLLRGLSAPVKLHMARSEAELSFLLAHDRDGFSRWDTGQQLALNAILGMIQMLAHRATPVLDDSLGAALRRSLQDCELLDGALENAFVAQLLSLPSEGYVAELTQPADPLAIHEAWVQVRRSIAELLDPMLMRVYEVGAESATYRFDAAAAGRRSLRNACLGYLMELDDASIRQRCLEQFYRSDNMTDTLAALACLADSEGPERAEALASFYHRWHKDALVVNKWFSIQAASRLPGTLEAVRALTAHPAFQLRNPNCVYALIRTFAQGNPARFHSPDGAGYRFLADQVLRLDPVNPQVAARLTAPLSGWRRYGTERQDLMRAELERILGEPKLSRDVYEIAHKSLS